MGAFRFCFVCQRYVLRQACLEVAHKPVQLFARVPIYDYVAFFGVFSFVAHSMGGISQTLTRE